MVETKEEYNERTKAVKDFVERNMTTDTSATKKSGVSLKTPLGGIGDKILDTVRTNVSLEKPLGGLGEKAMEAMFPYGAEGRFPQQERAVKTGMTAEGQPIGPDMQERLRAGVGSDVTKKSIAEESAAAVPVAATPSVEAPVPAGGTGPWSQGKRNEYLGLNEGKIVKGGGPGGTDLLTNREQPFTQPKELPQEAYGVGGSKEKEAMMADYEKEMRTPYASVEKIKAMERRLGIGNQMTEAQKAANTLERDKMKQTLDLAEADRSMKEEDKVMQIALALSPTFKTKDVNDMEEKITETKDLSIYEAMLKDGSIKGKAGDRLAKALEIVKSKQRKVLKPGDVVDGLRYKGGDSKKEGNWEKI